MWRIYYGHGAVYEGDPYFAPALNVQVIACRDDRCGWALLCGDYYVWDEAWRACDLFGLWDYLSQPGPRKVLFGRTLPNEEYQRVYQRAKAEFGPKSALLPGERKP